MQRRVFAPRTCLLVAAIVAGGGFAAPDGAAGQLSFPEGPEELTLEEALRLAREHNPDFRTQERQLETADLEVGEAWGGLMPSANLSNNYGFQASGERRFGDVRLGEQPEILSSSYSLGLSLTLNGSSLLRPGQARREARAAEARVSGAAVGLQAEITDAYLSVLEADAEVDQARAALERTGLNVREARARVEVGAATPLDIRRAEVQEGQAEVLLVQVENQAISARLALGRLVGVSLDEEVHLITDFELFDPDLDMDDLVQRAIDGNPVLHASRLSADVAEGGIQSARSQYLPSVSLSAGLSASVFQAGTLSPLVEDRLQQRGGQFESCVEDNRIRELLGDPPRNCQPLNPADPSVRADVRQQIEAENSGFPFGYDRQPWNLSLTISLPLFTGFSRGRQVERARIDHANANEQVRAEELRLRSEVNQAARGVETARRTVELQGRVRETAAEELRLAQERFRLGLASSIEMADAQATLSQAERDEITATYQFHQSVAALEALIGGAVR